MSTAVSRLARARQWYQFMRQWHLVDANQQDAYKLGERVATHLMGRHKPIWHPETDCGDHVVVVNCKDVAMHGFDWKHTLYHFNKEYPRSKANIPAWQIHEFDPCRIVFLAVYKGLGNNLPRRRHIQRLHLFPGEDVPAFVRQNIGNVATNYITHHIPNILPDESRHVFTGKEMKPLDVTSPGKIVPEALEEK